MLIVRSSDRKRAHALNSQFVVTSSLAVSRRDLYRASLHSTPEVKEPELNKAKRQTIFESNGHSLVVIGLALYRAHSRELCRAFEHWRHALCARPALPCLDHFRRARDSVLSGRVDVALCHDLDPCRPRRDPE